MSSPLVSAHPPESDNKSGCYMFINNDVPDNPSSTRWRLGEKYALYLFVATALFIVLKDAVTFSDVLAKGNKVEGLQESIWPGGRLIDLNDGQLRGFRAFLPALVLAAFLFVWLKTKWVAYSGMKGTYSKLQFYFISGLCCCVYLHGPGVAFLLLWVYVNYKAGEAMRGHRLFPVSLWAGNLGFLIFAEYTEGLKFAWVGLGLLDEFHPEMSWHRSSNLCLLKVISYLLDSHWKTLHTPTIPKEKHMLKCTECSQTVDCLKFRQETHADDYSLLAFFAYIFYFPLYLAGPTLSYNAWISQVYRPQQTYNTYKKVNYIIRLIIAMCILELSIHFLYFPTIANNPLNRKLYESFDAYQLAISSYLILKWIWLKFLVIWRFFRIWAICDGIESPENMGRCMSNNYCFEGFWRMWHRAFNQWLIRYLFIPLGGSKYKIYNIWVVFLFVAVWHDLSLHLLAWGWGMCVFIVPEVLAKAFIAQPRFKAFRQTAAYNWVAALCGGAYIILMMIANLVGFSFGLSGLATIWEEIVEGDGLVLLLKIWAIISVCTHLLFAWRRDEEKMGIRDKGF